MLRNRYVLAIIGALFLAVLSYNISFFLVRRPATKPQADKPSSVGSQTMKNPVSPFPVPGDKAPWKRDPFYHAKAETKKPAGPVKKKTPAPEIKLQGIIARNGGNFALINGWVLGIGDVLYGAQVVKISRGSVLLKDADGTKEISIYNDIPYKEK